MTFTEPAFAVFFLVVYALWWMTRNHYGAKSTMLVVASLVFYAYHQWELSFLILTYCVADWAFGLWIAQSAHPRRVLTLGVAFNLSLLAFWKYTPLVLRTIAQLAWALDLPAAIPTPTNWIIPFGLSFYAFTGTAYLVDVYRKETPAEAGLRRFTLNLVFFPHLVAGPILRASDFLKNLQPDSMPRRPIAVREALMLIARGLFEKMVLADRIAPAIDPFFAHLNSADTRGVWSLPYSYLYALQIYFDFSGYTDVARGLGLLFGFRWPENFNLPYLSTSIQQFWQRWHMTLSQFLRDYLYIPLGGNRYGAVRTQIHLMLTMLLGGLWHGASWTFLLWGGLHGAFLVVHRQWSQTAVARRLAGVGGAAGLLWCVAAWAITFHAVCFAWCFFRLTDVRAAWTCVRQWVAFDADKLLVGGADDVSLWLLLAAYGLGAWVAMQWGRWEKIQSPILRPTGAALRSGFAWGIGAAMLLAALLLSPGGEAPAFIYFQF